MRSRKHARRASALWSLAIACLAASCSPEAADDREPEPQAQSGAPVAEPGDASAKAPTGESSAPAQSAAARLAVDGDGLRWFLQPGGTERAIPFGTPQAEVVASLERVRGPAEQGTNQDCPTGPVQYANWSDGLSLLFEEGRFVGWYLNERASGAVETGAGIGPGDTRAQLAAAHAPEVRQGTLGTEFSAGDIHGVLDGPSAGARITHMWAGMSCVAT